MSDFDSRPGDGLDQWLANQHHKLVVDIADTVEVEAGLDEAMISGRHDRFVADLRDVLDVDAGLSAIVSAPSDVRTPPVSNRAGFRYPVRAFASKRGRVIAAIGVIALAVTAATILTNLPSNSRSSTALPCPINAASSLSQITTEPEPIPTTVAPPSTSTTPALDVLDYGVIMSCGPENTVVFTFTVSARGSGNLHYIWRPVNGISNESPRSEVLTFTGPTQTKEVVYPVSNICSGGQHSRAGMTVEIITPDSSRGATYDEFTCQ